MKPSTYYAKNRARINARCMAYRKRNAAKYKKYQQEYKKRWRARNRVKINAYMKRWKASDAGIRHRICKGTKLKPSSIPQELVELKRMNLKIYHELAK